MDLGVHLPLLAFAGEPLSAERVGDVAETARECGFAALAANDHLVFQRPWLDGPTALASVIERSGSMTLATTASLAVVRGPVAVAKALAATDLLSGGRLIAAIGAGSSRHDYEAVGIPFEERWARYDEALKALRALLEGTGIPLWVASWGSKAGLRRVAAAGDGWLASAYNTTPERFAAGLTQLGDVPNALATMWTWVTDDRASAERMLRDVLAPMLGREPEVLRATTCIGSPEHCAELLSRYAQAGCRRVYLWPLGDERRQVERIAAAYPPSPDPPIIHD
ncbi:LLM class flavin-dependent oxidoreductase [Solirubrobacter ginsenosidimutans]|uniref:LLM class flavin-dependent oxidoreductase n=1 Tax=Solirubrobacter ginsenosidimutans TaxID=490573 RepID=A0A9X3MUU3_9ACTN|nr:LLM class flavin-dependent oxidoreductase [Solirubrobacter ginsenosidimutans]MDA0162910.1 LLM class flavin-dependent oxidoreductase [Solirubrobacter ginsenosidimutans]